MRIDEVRAKSSEELKKELDEQHKGLLNLRFRWHTRQLENYEEIKKARKTIARMRTVLRERELGIETNVPS
ncbi:MAG: 50S ribosomal protein L29 [Chloroflexi bacterium]|nr:50S ribosomal protein L29 [Chloroflexota bacterium]